MNRRAFTLSSLALAACGGGGASNLSSKIIRVVSDSTGVGFALGASGYFRVDHPWPSYIDVPGYTVVNSSVGGMAMKDVDWSQQTGAVLIIGLCINDAFLYSESYYAGLLVHAVTVHRGDGTIIVFQTPNPTYEARVTAFAQVMRDVAKALNVPVIDQDRHLRETYSDLSFAGDQMHPSQPAYTVMGLFSQSRLQEILK